MNIQGVYINKITIQAPPVISKIVHHFHRVSCVWVMQLSHTHTQTQPIPTFMCVCEWMTSQSSCTHNHAISFTRRRRRRGPWVSGEWMETPHFSTSPHPKPQPIRNKPKNRYRLSMSVCLRWSKRNESDGRMDGEQRRASVWLTGSLTAAAVVSFSLHIFLGWIFFGSSFWIPACGFPHKNFAMFKFIFPAHTR